MILAAILGAAAGCLFTLAVLGTVAWLGGRAYIKRQRQGRA